MTDAWEAKINLPNIWKHRHSEFFVPRIGTTLEIYTQGYYGLWSDCENGNLAQKSTHLTKSETGNVPRVVPHSNHLPHSHTVTNCRATFRFPKRSEICSKHMDCAPITGGDHIVLSIAIRKMPIFLLRAPCAWTLTLCDFCESNLRIDTVANPWGNHAWQRPWVAIIAKYGIPIADRALSYLSLLTFYPTAGSPTDIVTAGSAESRCWLNGGFLPTFWVLPQLYQRRKGANRIQNRQWSSFTHLLCEDCVQIDEVHV